jgi:hypothetical protein
VSMPGRVCPTSITRRGPDPSDGPCSNPLGENPSARRQRESAGGGVASCRGGDQDGGIELGDTGSGGQGDGDGRGDATERPDDKHRATVEFRWAETLPADGLTTAQVVG